MKKALWVVICMVSVVMGVISCGGSVFMAVVESADSLEISVMSGETVNETLKIRLSSNVDLAANAVETNAAEWIYFGDVRMSDIEAVRAIAVRPEVSDELEGGVSKRFLELKFSGAPTGVFAKAKASRIVIPDGVLKDKGQIGVRLNGDVSLEVRSGAEVVEREGDGVIMAFDSEGQTLVRDIRLRGVKFSQGFSDLANAAGGKDVTGWFRGLADESESSWLKATATAVSDDRSVVTVSFAKSSEASLSPTGRVEKLDLVIDSDSLEGVQSKIEVGGMLAVYVRSDVRTLSIGNSVNITGQTQVPIKMKTVTISIIGDVIARDLSKNDASVNTAIKRMIFGDEYDGDFDARLYTSAAAGASSLTVLISGYSKTAISDSDPGHKLSVSVPEDFVTGGAIALASDAQENRLEFNIVTSPVGSVVAQNYLSGSVGSDYEGEQSFRIVIGPDGTNDNSKFKPLPIADEDDGFDVSSWLNLPSGMRASAKLDAVGAEPNHSSKLVITVSGTPDKASSDKLRIVVPTEYYHDGKGQQGADSGLDLLCVPDDVAWRVYGVGAVVSTSKIEGMAGQLWTYGAGEIRIEIEGDEFKPIAAGTDVMSDEYASSDPNLEKWIRHQSFPAGITMKVRNGIDDGAGDGNGSGKNAIALVVEGTPASGFTDKMRFVIPGGALKSGLPIEVACGKNSEGKLLRIDIGPAAYVSDVVITGVKDSPFQSDQKITVNLIGCLFKELNVTDYINYKTHWNILVPDGLAAGLDSDVSENTKTAVLKIEGTPSGDDYLDVPIRLEINKNDISVDSNVVVTENVDARILISAEQ